MRALYEQPVASDDLQRRELREPHQRRARQIATKIQMQSLQILQPAQWVQRAVGELAAHREVQRGEPAQLRERAHAGVGEGIGGEHERVERTQRLEVCERSVVELAARGVQAAQRGECAHGPEVVRHAWAVADGELPQLRERSERVQCVGGELGVGAEVQVVQCESGDPSDVGVAHAAAGEVQRAQRGEVLRQVLDGGGDVERCALLQH